MNPQAKPQAQATATPCFLSESIRKDDYTALIKQVIQSSRMFNVIDDDDFVLDLSTTYRNSSVVLTQEILKADLWYWTVKSGRKFKTPRIAKKKILKWLNNGIVRANYRKELNKENLKTGGK